MQNRSDLKNCNGTILVVTLWILTILTVFAVALGQRASLAVKLAEYQRDKLKAIELTKAAIERAILEKKNDTFEKIDALSESWANNEPAFKDFELDDEAFTGMFTVSYSLDETTLYGMEDEKSKININLASQSILEKLFENCENPDKIVTSIVAWYTDSEHEEDTYYETPDLPYPRKRGPFKSIPELLLVHDMTPEILYGEDRDSDNKISEDEQGIAQYITVYGDDGAVNINTASKKVLGALIGDTLPDLVDKIVDYRKGVDGIIGTIDDHWFSIDSDTVNLSGEPAKNLKADYSTIKDDPFFSISSTEWAKLQTLEAAHVLSVSSNIYSVHAQAEVKKAKASITATIRIDLSVPEPEQRVEYLFWHRN